MSTRVEWMDPTYTNVDVHHAGTELGEWQVDAPYALSLSADEVVVFEGSKTELVTFARRITAKVAQLAPSASEPSPQDAPALNVPDHVIDAVQRKMFTPAKHSQRCPVWLNRASHPKCDTCTCWARTQALAVARVAVAAYTEGPTGLVAKLETATR